MIKSLEDYLLKEELSNEKAYMLRNDGKIIDCGKIHPYLSKLNDFEDLDSYLKTEVNLKALNFLYINTQYQNVKNEIESLKNKNEDLLLRREYCKNCLHNLNQEFLRFRLGGEYWKKEVKEIYFRVSSQRFNWFDLIWNFVYKHKNEIDNVTIEHDFQTFKDRRKYSINGKELNHIPIQEFITLSGNPIIESLDEELENNWFLKNLNLGKSILESAETLPSHRARVIYESTLIPEIIDYDLKSCLKVKGENKK